ncbi:MAG: exosortase system-associated protein, TIGR04073 family [Verrucomicrobiae bacterium]|nr:exosortase system-associated protein, TIGR04073 family [Verrucomicrobiae bacterium]
MCNVICWLGLAILVAGLGAGCAGPEKKLGRGMNNATEFLRLGELRRSVEQTALFDSPESAYTTGFIRGMNRTLARTGIGIYEIITFPFPSYEPVLTHKFSAKPVYPDTYRPNLIEDQTFAPDTSLGFAGGDVIPFVPGSRFRVFDN